MKTLSERLQETQVAAVEEVKGPAVVTEQGVVTEPPTISELQSSVEDMVRAIIGQRTIPRTPDWSMSNNRSARRLDSIFTRLDTLDQARAERGVLIEQMQAQINAIPGLIEQAMQTILQATTLNLEQTNQAQDAAAAAQFAAFTQALAKQRQDLLAEIVGSAAPLLETINQIKAMDLAEDAEEAAIHNQLFALLGEQSTKLTQLLTKQTTQDGLLTTAAANITSLQSSVTNLGTEQASLKLVDQGLRADLTTQTGRVDGVLTTATGLRTDLTTQTGRIDTVTTTANAANALSNTNKTDIAALKAIPIPSFALGTGNPIAVKERLFTGTTDSAGRITLTQHAGLFTTIYRVDPEVIRAVTGSTQYGGCEVVSISLTQIVIQVWESKSTGVLILNTMVEGLEASPAGVTVNITVHGI